MKYYDVSADTSLSVRAPRRLPRRLIVLHTTMGYNSRSWLQGGSAAHGTPASADFLVDRLGNIYQLIPPGWYSYHSGTARWRWIQDPDYTLNQSAVGIEIEAAEHRGQRITDLQYIATAALLDALMAHHAILVDRIVTHAMVALPPGRKKDPMTLDWQVMMREMVQASKEAAGLIIPAVLP